VLLGILGVVLNETGEDLRYKDLALGLLVACVGGEFS
jgi:hypothetical protein